MDGAEKRAEGRSKRLRARYSVLGMAHLVALAWSGAAAAQDRPPRLRLEQDAAVTFRIPAGGAAAALAAGVDPRSAAGQALLGLPEVLARSLRQAATGQTLVEPPGVAAVAAWGAKRVRVLDAAAAGTGAGAGAGVPGDSRPAALGMEEAGQDPDVVAEREEGVAAGIVAGLPCTDWRLRPRGGGPDAPVYVVCFAGDGLALRVTERGGRLGGGGAPRLLQEAVRVEYGPLDPALFAPPGTPAGTEAGRQLPATQTRR